MAMFKLMAQPTPFLFFTGKGGVGKTSLSCACAIALADAGKRVLLVSTDPASNLDEMLSVELADRPTPVPGIEHLCAMNIDPEAAADRYRARVIAQLGPDADEAEKATVREQLSGACTTEIAAFDEFVGLLTGDGSGFDHVVFDTAPTGHTLRLLSLPRAWTGFLAGNDRGASCLGPHSGLKMRKDRFRRAMQALGDAARTTIVLVTRADSAAIREAGRTAYELRSLGLSNQMLAVNGRFHTMHQDDDVARALEADQDAALAHLPDNLATLPRDEFPLLSFDMVGLPALRALLSGAGISAAADLGSLPPADLPTLDRLVADIAAGGKGLVMVMGKGGVGKTTVAAAIAAGLAARGHGVHLTTTDPAAHLTFVIDGTLPGLTVDRIDPVVETAHYIEKVMASRGRTLDAEAQALLREDLASPCTEEVAVFHAFSRIVAEARDSFVIVDTAPTGHTLLLLDATGAYHRQMTRQMSGTTGRMVTPLMRLQDPAYTKIILVTLPEATPVSEAASLQHDLDRAGIRPFAWVVNRSMAASGTHDPILASRVVGEKAQIARVRQRYSNRVFALAYQLKAPVGLAALRRITDPAP